MDQELSTVESVYEWLPYTQDARNARIALNGMQKWEGLAQGVPLQTGLPAPLDFTMSVLGQEGMSHLGFFQKLLKRQVEGIHGIDPSALVQFEMPVSLGLAHGSRFNPKLPSGEIIARSFTDFVAILPEETNIGLHLCVGDLDHIARVDKVDAALVESEVALTGLILNNWPKGRKMPKYVHMPFAAGKNPPLLEQNVYNPLEGLRDVLPADTLLVAGLAHESLGKEDQLRLVPMIEGPLERRVAVATACGLGRMTLDNAHTAMRNMGVAANA